MPLNPVLAKILPTLAPLNKFPIEEGRAISLERAKRVSKKYVPKVAALECTTVKTSKRETPVRIYRPTKKGIHPVFVYIHGGGFVFGSANTWDRFCSLVSKRANCIVINIDYGLAPEHKFPEPVNECYEVVKWIKDNAKELQVDTSKIAIGGDSAGGNIATVIASLAKVRQEFSIFYQVLIYPVLDVSIDPYKRVYNGKVDTARAEVEAWFNEMYFKNPDDGKSILASPILNNDLKGVADAMIITAEYDPLTVEEQIYAKKLIEAGVNVYIQRVDGMTHGYMNWTKLLKEAGESQNLVCSQLNRVFNKK